IIVFSDFVNGRIAETAAISWYPATRAISTPGVVGALKNARPVASVSIGVPSERGMLVFGTRRPSLSRTASVAGCEAPSLVGKTICAGSGACARAHGAAKIAARNTAAGSSARFNLGMRITWRFARTLSLLEIDGIVPGRVRFLSRTLREFLARDPPARLLCRDGRRHSARRRYRRSSSF